MEEKEITDTNPNTNTNNRFYAYCRIPGGMVFKVQNPDKSERSIILKSGTSKTVAPDGTVNFSVNTGLFGITELTKDEKIQIEKQIKPCRFYQSGFVFFASSREAGDKQAAENARKNPEIGLEPLDVSKLTSESAQAFKA